MGAERYLPMGLQVRACDGRRGPGRMTYLIYRSGRLITAIDLRLPASYRPERIARIADRHARQYLKTTDAICLKRVA